MKALPRGATPIDFAYAIHTDVGHQCVGARVNGKMVPLRTRLKNGDIVEIITQAGHKPSRDWLNFVVTSRARNKIKHLHPARGEGAQHRARTAAVREGGAALRPEPEDAARERRRSRRSPTEYGGGKADELLAHDRLRQAVAARTVLEQARCRRSSCRRSRPKARSPRSSSACCGTRRGPDQGERHRRPDGVPRALLQPDPRREDRRLHHARQGRSVHSATCPNVVNLLYDPERRIDVEWDKRRRQARATPCG